MREISFSFPEVEGFLGLSGLQPRHYVLCFPGLTSYTYIHTYIHTYVNSFLQFQSASLLKKYGTCQICNFTNLLFLLFVAVYVYESSCVQV